MKKYLAVFDLDWTLVDYPERQNRNSFKAIYENQELPENFKELRSNPGVWQQHFIDTINNRNLSNEDLEKVLDETHGTKNISVTKGMDELLKFLFQDHDIIVISDGSTYRVKQFLKLLKLDQFITVVYSSTVDLNGNGKLVKNELPSKWKAPCQYGGINICKGQIMLDFAKSKNYKRILYFGDGHNDYCPAMTLSENDLVFPRMEFELEELLVDETNCKAKIMPWNTGFNVLSYLQKVTT